MIKNPIKLRNYGVLFCVLTLALHAFAMDLAEPGQVREEPSNKVEQSFFQKNWLQATNYKKFHSVDHYSNDVFQDLTLDRNESYTKFYEANAYRKCINLVGNFSGFSQGSKQEFKKLIQSFGRELSIRTKRELKQKGKLHLLETVLDSETFYRKVPVLVGDGSNAFSPTAKSLDEVARQMDDFTEELFTKIFEANADAIQIAAWTLHRFNSIHPFIDGNGRTSRLLMNMILVHFGRPSIVLEDVNGTDEYTKSLEEADKANFEPLYQLLNNCIAQADILDAEFAPSFQVCSEDKMLEIFEDEPQCIQQ